MRAGLREGRVGKTEPGFDQPRSGWSEMRADGAGGGRVQGPAPFSWLLSGRNYPADRRVDRPAGRSRCQPDPEPGRQPGSAGRQRGREPGSDATKQATQIQDATGNCFDFGLAKLLNCHVATPLTIENAKLMAGIAPGWGNSWRISAITVALFNKTRRTRIECHDNQIK